MMYVYLPPGGVLFEEDDFGDSMYVILSGQLNVRSQPIIDPSTTVKESTPKLRGSGSEVATGSQYEAKETEKSETVSVEKDDLLNSDASEKSSARSSEYWIGKYFLQAQSVIKAQDEISGSGNLASPLASIYAAKWRQKISDKKSQDEKDDTPDRLTGNIPSSWPNLTGGLLYLLKK